MKRAILVLALVVAFFGTGATITAAADAVQTVPLSPGSSAGLDSNDGMVHIQIPSNNSSINFALRYSPNPGSTFSVRPADSILLPNSFYLDFPTGGDGYVSALNEPGTLVMKYRLSDLGGRSEATLKMMRLPEDGSTWLEIPSTLDIAARTVAAQFTLPGSYALAASNVTPTAVPAPVLVPVPAPAPAAVPAPALPSGPTQVPAPAAPPSFKLGFAMMASLMDIVGQPIEEEHYGPNGDSLQHTTKGLMVWRKADNWTAFTNGYLTWINGPFGLQSRPNDDRFAWER